MDSMILTQVRLGLLPACTGIKRFDNIYCEYGFCTLSGVLDDNHVGFSVSIFNSRGSRFVNGGIQNPIPP